MFRCVLVPLDRSPFAEQALPLALSIARRARANLDLMQVHEMYALAEQSRGRTPFELTRDAEYRQNEEMYVNATARWLTAASPVPVTAAVVCGSAVEPGCVADGILERARVSNADLIVMTTHRRGPGSRFILGSVADELVRRASVPLLLMRPSEAPVRLIPEPMVESILIPLDGSPLAEQVLEPALDLARLLEARCTLLRVIESSQAPANRGPGGPLATALEEATAYLERVAEKVRQESLHVHARVLVAQRAAEAILDAAQTQVSSLIALATHGRGGVRRMLLGSVADKVIRGATTPVLVYRPPAN